jgi:hypothetical protein
MIPRNTFGAPPCTKTPTFPKLVGNPGDDFRLFSLDHDETTSSIAIGGDVNYSPIIMYYTGL